MAATDRPIISEAVLIGLEAVQGTMVSATKRLNSLKIESSPKPSVSTFKASGSKGVNVASLDSEMDEPKVSGKPSYPELPYLFAGAVQKVVAGSLVATTAAVYDWTFTPNTYSADTFASLTIDYGSEVRNETAAGNIFTALSFKFDRTGESAVSGSLIAPRFEDDKLRYLSISGTPTAGDFTITVNGQVTATIAYTATAAAIQTALEALSTVGAGNVVCSGGPVSTTPVRVLFKGILADAASPTVSVASTVTGGTARVTRLYPSPTQLAKVLVRGPDIDVFVATTYAGLAGATKQRRVFAGDWGIGSRNAPIWEFDSSNPSFADTAESDPKGDMTVTVGANDANMNLFLTAGRTSSFLFVRILATGPTIEVVGANVFKHQLRLTTCVAVTGWSEKKVNGAIVSRDFKCEFADDPTWGQMYETYVRTTTAAL